MVRDKNPTDQFKKIKARYNRQFRRIQSQIYTAPESKQHELSLKTIRLMTEQNLELAKLGYWYDDEAERWTNEPQPPPTDREKLYREFRAKLMVSDEEKAFELLRLYLNT